MMEGKDPYLFAAFFRQENILKLLIEYGANHFRTRPQGFTALHAVIFGATRTKAQPTESIVAVLLQYRPDLEQLNYDSMTPLMCSAGCGFLALTKILLDHGANIHASDSDCRTSLHYAVFAKNTKVLALLICLGVRVDVRTFSDGMTALHCDCTNISRPCAQTARRLSDARADSDALDIGLGVRRTPLHLAASCGNIDAINHLVAYGTNV